MSTRASEATARYQRWHEQVVHTPPGAGRESEQAVYKARSGDWFVCPFDQHTLRLMESGTASNQSRGRSPATP
jgi:hypothetical protein